MDSVKEFYQPATSVLSTDYRFSSHQLSSQTHPCLSSFFTRQKIEYLTTKINGQGRVVLLGSPEAYALTTGLLQVDEKQLELLPARLHFGPARSLDNRVACFQAFQIPEIKSFFAEAEASEQQLLLTDLLREGQKTQAQEAVHYLFNQQPTNALVNVSHQQDESTPLGRIAVVDEPNLEGVALDKVTHMVLSDSIASGVTQFYALKYFADKLPNLEKVLIVSPHLTKYGSLNLCRYLGSLGIDLILLGYGAWLDSREPDLYFSPTPVNNEKYFVDSKQAQLMLAIYGDLASKLGVAGNWTAMFLSPSEGKKWLKEELEEIGGSMQDIKQLSLDEIKEIGFKLKELVPASTWIQASYNDKLDLLA